VPVLPRAEIIEQALDNSYIVVTNTLDEAMQFSNQYAPEHLILATAGWKQLIPNIINAGSVFLGSLTPESVGDYASGTITPCLPALMPGHIRVCRLIHLLEDYLSVYIAGRYTNIGPIVEILAELEGLHAHKNAVSVRMNKE